MKKVAFVLSLALGATVAVTVANAGTGTATTLMVKELPDLPGKDGMVEVVDFAPGEVSQPHRHNADLFVYVLEGTIVTQVEGEAPKNLKAGKTGIDILDFFLVSPNVSVTEIKTEDLPDRACGRKGERILFVC